MTIINAAEQQLYYEMPKSECPNCGTTLEYSTSTDAVDTRDCPNCNSKASVFSQDTWVPNRVASNVDTNHLELRIPGYSLIKVIGKGGMGVVLEGKQNSLGRRVAIKILATTLANDLSFVKRFVGEAQTLARLAHPNIVTIIDQGSSDNSLYFVMEYVEGGNGNPTDLRCILRERAVSIHETKGFISQIAKALAYAHSNGVIHRDIKPANILIDRHGNAKVADFGIAAFASNQIHVQLTQPSTAMGTLDYMSPEQRDDAASVDARTDIYSLGVLLYELITGKLPRGAFKAASELVEGLDPQWDYLVDKCLKPSVDDRLSEMGSVLKILDQIDCERSSSNARLPKSTQVAVSCPECQSQISAEAKFCPKCRTSQWTNCNSCNTEVRSGIRFCPECGKDIQQYLSYIKKLETVKQYLQDSKNEALEITEQYSNARKAESIAHTALREHPEDRELADLHGSARRIAAATACKAADESYKRKDLSAASHFLEQVLSINPEHETAKSLITRIRAFKEDYLKRAEYYLDSGSPRQAIGLFEALAKNFQDDTQIAERLRHCIAIQSNVSKIVKEEIPNLASQNKWWSVNEAIERLSSYRVQVQGVEGYASNVKSRLAQAAGLIDGAEEMLSRGLHSVVVEKSEQCLKIVSDYPLALDLLAKAQLHVSKDSELLLNLEQACKQSRWFQVPLILERHKDCPDNARISSLVSIAKRGRDAANRHASLLLWASLGGAMLVAVNYLATIFVAGLFDDFSDSRSIKASAAMWVFSIVGTAIGVLLIRTVLRTKVSVARFVSIVATWGIAIGVRVFASNYLSERPGSPGFSFLAESILDSVGASLAISLACKDLLNPAVKHYVLLIFVGMSSSLIATFAMLYKDSYGVLLIAAMWLASLMVISGLFKSGLRAIGVVALGGIIGVIGVGLARVHPEKNYALQTVLPVALLLVGAISLQEKKSLASIAITIILGVFAIFLRDIQPTRSLTVWWAMTAYIAFDTKRHIDANLYFRDRIASMSLFQRNRITEAASPDSLV